jgi:L-arabinokinase
LLVGFGGHDTNWSLKDSSLPDGWVGWVLGAKAADLPPGGKFFPIPFDCYVPDLIAASDVVLGKLGYGTVSECLTHRTPLVYVPRSQWPEEEPLRVYLEGQSGGVRMPVEAFVTGDWAEYLHAAMKLDIINHPIGDDNNPVGKMFADPKLVALMGPKFLSIVG